MNEMMCMCDMREKSGERERGRGEEWGEERRLDFQYSLVGAGEMGCSHWDELHMSRTEVYRKPGGRQGWSKHLDGLGGF